MSSQEYVRSFCGGSGWSAVMAGLPHLCGETCTQLGWTTSLTSLGADINYTVIHDSNIELYMMVGSMSCISQLYFILRLGTLVIYKYGTVDLLYKVSIKCVFTDKLELFSCFTYLWWSQWTNWSPNLCFIMGLESKLSFLVKALERGSCITVHRNETACKGQVNPWKAETFQVILPYQITFVICTSSASIVLYSKPKQLHLPTALQLEPLLSTLFFINARHQPFIFFSLFFMYYIVLF